MSGLQKAVDSAGQVHYIKSKSYVRRSHPDSMGWFFLFGGRPMRLVMIDNYDSFTYNLVQLFSEFDLEVMVFRHDEIGLDGIAALEPDWLCISPGPKAPDQAGISKAAIAHFYRSIPILGVCLGHQALNEVFGGATVKAPIAGARQTPSGVSYGPGGLQRLALAFSSRPLSFPHGAPHLPGPGSHRLDRRRRHHGPETPPLSPPRGPVPPGILPHQPRPRPGRELLS